MIQKTAAISAVRQATRNLRVARLNSIKSRILALAILGTIIPAGVTLGIAYTQNQRSMESKITRDLLSESSQSASAISVWLKLRLYDLRVFANSDEVLSNLGTTVRGQTSPRLREYLRSLHDRFPDFERLLVLDAAGRVIASGSQRDAEVHLPENWQRALRTQGQFVGDAYWDGTVGKAKLLVAVPVHRPDGRVMGAFAAEIHLAPLHKTLTEFAQDTSIGAIHLVSDSGEFVASSRGLTRQILGTRVNAPVMRRLSSLDNAAMTFVNYAGVEVIGAHRPVPQTRWAVIAEVPTAVAFEQVRAFGNLALAVVALLLLVIGATAYRLGLLIVRPLEHLAEGASKMSMGDFDVQLPHAGQSDEVGLLTRVFSDMVTRLRAGLKEIDAANENLRIKNEELERLSVTDGLTGLANHRALMQRLNDEAVRSRRSRRPFALIMCDVDYFKKYNDEFGHPEGDRVLKQVATIVKDATRNVDCVARYGGEEFAILLPETEMSGAIEVAERIRSRVESAEFPCRKITLSIGVAEFPKHAATHQEIVVVADAALYIAKNAGRNQVARAPDSDKRRRLPQARSAKVAKKA